MISALIVVVMMVVVRFVFFDGKRQIIGEWFAFRRGIQIGTQTMYICILGINIK